jgi:hypothetical protein
LCHHHRRHPGLASRHLFAHGSVAVLATPPLSHRLVHLEPRPLEDPAYNATEPRLSDARNVVYIARATVENAQVIAAQVKSSLAASK